MSESNDANRDAYLVKTDENGTEEWSQHFGDVDSQELGFSVQQTTDGGYIIGGTQNPLQGGAGNSDMLLIKTSENGSEEWTQTLESAPEFDDTGYAVLQTEDGCYALLGATSGGEQSAAYLVKTCAEASTTPLLTSTDKKMVRVIDLLGREVVPATNQILLYIFDDGSVEKRWLLEE